MAASCGCGSMSQGRRHTTLRDRFMTNLAARARRCEPDAIRLCNIAFGRGRGPGNQSGRPRVGLSLPAAWDVVAVGSYVWHGGELGRVRTKEHAGATTAVFTAGAMPRRVTARTNVRFTMSSLRNKKAGPFGAAALQGRGDRGREERGPPSQ